MMNQREKVLAGGFAVVIVFVVGDWLLSTFFLTPIEERNNRVASLQTSIEKHTQTKNQIFDTTKKMSDWNKQQSLPPDALKASTVYHDWLVKLADNSGFVDARIEPGTGKPVSDTYVKIPMTIQAETKFSNLQKFLHDFHRADLLHKMIRLDCRPKDSKPDPVIAVMINVEAISLTGAEDRNELDPKMGKPTRPVFEENLFARGYNGPTAPRAQPRDLSEFVKLVATFEENGKWSGRLYDTTNKESTVLTPGEDFSVQGVMSGAVVSATRDIVMLRIDGQDKEMKLGDTLNDLRSGQSTASATKPATKEKSTVEKATEESETETASDGQPAGDTPKTTQPTETKSQPAVEG